MTFRLARPLALTLVLAAAAWLHVASLSTPFFSDDFLFLDQVRARSLFQALAGGDPIGNYLRPVSRAAWFWMLSAASGESARAFHLANLALFLGILVLLDRIARRLLPQGAALAGVALLAVHHAADVPLMWASGSQDLLAVLGALAAIELHAAGRRTLAVVALVLALLSKETVVLAPLAAVAIARGPREPWRAALQRAWPLFAGLGAWLAAWVATLSRRPAMGHEVQVRAGEVAAAFVHLFQTAVGIEWPLAGFSRAFHALPPLALAVAATGVALAVSLRSRPVPVRAANAVAPAPRLDSPRALAAGALWAVAGAAPVAAVAGIWSGYYYLFSLCGVALVAGALVAGRPLWVTLLPVLLVGFTSENARRLPEFAATRGAWNGLSHVNRHYLVRGTVTAGRLLDDLRRARPALPPASTLYFAGLPVSVAFQTADGPLVRWAYRDSSLRSYFLGGFRAEHARRGPLFFFEYGEGGLNEITGRDSLARLGYSMLLGDTPAIARDMLALAWRAEPSDVNAYRLAWAELAAGRADSAAAWLARAGYAPEASPAPEIEPAVRRVVAGDTLGAVAIMQDALRRHALDPGAHALMADLHLTTHDMEHGAFEAFVARLLAPDDAISWRRWGMVLADLRRDAAAVAALERYQALAGGAALGDGEVAALLESLRRMLPGGDVAQRALGRVTR